MPTDSRWENQNIARVVSVEAYKHVIIQPHSMSFVSLRRYWNGHLTNLLLVLNWDQRWQSLTEESLELLGSMPLHSPRGLRTNRIMLGLKEARLGSGVAPSSWTFLQRLSCTILTTKSCMWRALSQKEGSSQKKLEGKTWDKTRTEHGRPMWDYKSASRGTYRLLPNASLGRKNPGAYFN